MTILEKLQKIQVELKVTKNQTNAFGKYKYRSAEDILEAVKPFEDKYKVVFKITDELKELAGHVYVDSEAKVIDTESTDRESSISSTAQAKVAQLAPKAILKVGSPEYNKVLDFMSKGGELAKVKLKYNVSAEVEKSLKF